MTEYQVAWQNASWSWRPVRKCKWRLSKSNASTRELTTKSAAKQDFCTIRTGQEFTSWLKYCGPFIVLPLPVSALIATTVWSRIAVLIFHESRSMGRNLPDAKSESPTEWFRACTVQPGGSSSGHQTRAMPDANTWADYEEPRLQYEGINKALNVMTDAIVEQGWTLGLILQYLLRLFEAFEDLTCIMQLEHHKDFLYLKLLRPYAETTSKLKYHMICWQRPYKAQNDREPPATTTRSQVDRRSLRFLCTRSKQWFSI